MNEKIFIQKALKCYDNPSCISVDEFKSDLDRFSHLKKIFNKYADGSILNERLVLNHLIICFNVFGNTTLELVFYKVDKHNWHLLIPFLLFLNRIPEDYHIEGIYPISDITLDKNMIDRLRKI